MVLATLLITEFVSLRHGLHLYSRFLHVSKLARLNTYSAKLLLYTTLLYILFLIYFEIISLLNNYILFVYGRRQYTIMEPRLICALLYV